MFDRLEWDVPVPHAERSVSWHPSVLSFILHSQGLKLAFYNFDSVQRRDFACDAFGNLWENLQINAIKQKINRNNYDLNQSGSGTGSGRGRGRRWVSLDGPRISTSIPSSAPPASSTPADGPGPADRAPQSLRRTTSVWVNVSLLMVQTHQGLGLGNSWKTFNAIKDVSTDVNRSRNLRMALNLQN